MTQLFKLIGSPLTIPVTVGFNNLTEEQKEDIFNQSWCSDDFDNAHAEPFFEFLGSMWSAEMDLRPVDALSILDESGFEYQFRRGLGLYGLRFERDNRGVPTSAVIQEFEKVNFLLPEDPTDEQAMQMIDVLARNVYGGEFNPESCRVSQVIKDLAGYADMTDDDFDALRNEPMQEILTTLFEQCRVTSDIVGLMSEFFNIHLGRTL